MIDLLTVKRKKGSERETDRGTILLPTRKAAIGSDHGGPPAPKIEGCIFIYASESLLHLFRVDQEASLSLKDVPES